MLGTRDLRSFCRRPVGVPVTFAGVSTYTDDGTEICGIYDRPITAGLGEYGGAGVGSAKPTLMLPYNAFDPMPESGDRITVTPIDVPVEYLVNEPTAQEDGAFQLYELSGVNGEVDE